ncbi:ATP-binding protein [Sphingomonas sp. KR1UV-12]|uniref:histidine kinase n=1 Tax=Sphingomonas aurea TaxID=3063994 RepID=A0ABT9EPC4_9SPHN|nr:ATP-binding protein [Sphingomonas sp. KR1UV-12]MDP1028685.1 ATP-binding protein [Sphingomonas sp. KR1UV-12]
MSKHWKERLEQQNRLFNAALSNIVHGLCMFDDRGRLILCNTAYARMYDLPPELTREGTPHDDIMAHCIAHGCAPAELDCYFAVVAEAESQHRPAVQNIVLADGRVVKISHSPMDGHAYVATHQDVTEKVRVTDELARANDTLEAKVRERTELVWRQAEVLERLLLQERETNREQRQFVAMASHEFRTPLTIIDGAAQRLLRHRDRGDALFVGEKAEQIRSSVARIIDLMESILEVGRHDAGKGRLVYAPTDLAAMLRRCCERQASISPTHRFHLDLDELGTTIEADESALQQVFTNLLSNAVKYSRGKPDIDIRAWQTGHTVHVAVRDQGIGIDEEDIPQMFDRYFRARTSTGIAGTGIGLHLARQIVDMHQGSIALVSKPGHGSTFTVSLPCTAPADNDVTDLLSIDRMDHSASMTATLSTTRPIG